MLGNTKTENVTSYQINKGLRIARKLLLDLVSIVWRRILWSGRLMRSLTE